MDATEIAKRLREVGVDANIVDALDGVRIPVATAVTLLDSLLSATGTEQASALVTRLADTNDNTYNDSGFCYFCGQPTEEASHTDDCLWQLANAWKEQWA